VFLITAGMLEEADEFLLLMKKQINTFYEHKELINFLGEVRSALIKAEVPYSPANMAYALDRALDRARDLVDHLVSYLKANKLLVDCLNTECYISRDNRQKILDELFTVPEHLGGRKGTS